MEPVRGYNIYKTGYSAEKLMAYFEKNGIFEIVQKLLLETIHERPVDGRKFIAENIRRIAGEVQSTNTLILLPPIFDFPRNCEEIAKLKGTGFKPNTVIEVRHGFQVPFKTREKFAEDEASFITEFKEVEECYSETFKTMYFDSRCATYENRERFHQNVEEILSKLISVMRNTNSKRLDHANGRFCNRVVIFGRRGSGRKTQAIALAKKYELVYINTEALIAEYLASPCGLGQFLRDTMKKNEQIPTAAIATVIYKRILQKDSVTNGWVIVGFPFDLKGFQYMDKFLTPPNKIIVLHCRERVALRRIAKRAASRQKCKCVKVHCCKPLEKFSMEYIKKEMEFYTLNKEPILKFLEVKKETIHVDGNHSSDTVQTNIWARIEQNQHKIGMTFPPL